MSVYSWRRRDPRLDISRAGRVVVVVPAVLLRVSGLKGLVPLVVAQIVVGIALGPSLFGRMAPEIYQTFVNPASVSALWGIGSVAILIFGLVTGLHLDSTIFHGNGRALSAVAAANVIVPTALGCLAGYWILARHPEELQSGINPAEFAVAVGICTGMTALPVLGAILGEMNLLGHRIGHFALGIAAINDTVLWILPGRPFDGGSGASSRGPGSARPRLVHSNLPSRHGANRAAAAR